MGQTVRISNRTLKVRLELCMMKMFKPNYLTIKFEFITTQLH